MPQNPLRGQNTAESLGASASITFAKQSSFDFAKPWVVDIPMLCSSVSFKSHTDTEKNQTSCNAITIKVKIWKKERFECFCWELRSYFQWEGAYAKKIYITVPCKLVRRKIREDHYKCQSGILAFLFNLAS